VPPKNPPPENVTSQNSGGGMRINLNPNAQPKLSIKENLGNKWKSLSSGQRIGILTGALAADLGAGAMSTKLETATAREFAISTDKNVEAEKLKKAATAAKEKIGNLIGEDKTIKKLYGAKNKIETYNDWADQVYEILDENLLSKLGVKSDSEEKGGKYGKWNSENRRGRQWVVELQNNIFNSEGNDGLFGVSTAKRLVKKLDDLSK
jgi:hypothetical protein